jgi:hypothetical protein
MKGWSLFHANIRVIQVMFSGTSGAALYARVANKTIRAVTSPLEHLSLTLRLAR